MWTTLLDRSNFEFVEVMHVTCILGDIVLTNALLRCIAGGCQYYSAYKGHNVCGTSTPQGQVSTTLLSLKSGNVLSYGVSTT